MALMLTRQGVFSRMHGFRHGARGLMHGADSALRSDNRFMRTGGVSLSSFAFGVLQGKYKDRGGAVAWGLPVDLLAGAAFHVIGVLPFAKAYSNLFSAAGDGAFASFFTTTGYRVGERWSKGGSFTSGIAGMFGDSAAVPVTGGSSIADRELSSLVRAE